MGHVRIVTDSAADLPEGLAAARGIEIVPLTISFGSQSYVSGTELSTEDFWKKLRSEEQGPATAAPSAGDFQERFQRLVDDGAEGIVSVHLSSKLSATYQSATIAAQELGSVPVEVVDTLGVSAATGLPALQAADWASEGMSARDIASRLAETCSRTHLFGVIDTLEYLRRGGRIGGAQALLGSMLKVKPVISLAHGEVEPIGRVRTRAKALEHLVGIIREHRDRIERIVIMNGDAPDVDTLLGLLQGVVDIPSEDVWLLGPVVGTHAGPGVIGTVFITAS